MHRRLDELVDVVGSQPVLDKPLAEQPDLELGNLRLLLDHQILHAGHIGDRPLHPLRRAPQHAEVVAVDLDTHLRLDAREHMADEVGQRLLDRDHDSRNLRQLLAKFLEHLLAVASGLRIEAHDDLRGIDAFGVLVEFRPPRPPAERGHAANLADAVIDHRGDRGGGVERGARRQQHVDLHAALVERRQEVAAQPHHDGHARPDRDGHRP